MRRRKVHSADGVPEELAFFRVSDWPTLDSEDAFRLWREARRRYAEVHGWLGGDPLAMLATESDVRAVLRRGFLLWWGRSDDELRAVQEDLRRRYGHAPPLLRRSDPRDVPKRSPGR